MKRFRIILAGLLAVLTLLSVFTLSAGANTVTGENLGKNWDAYSTKYSSNTDKAIPRATGNDLFRFEEQADGSIKVDVPDSTALPGAYAATVLESRNKTTLDNLTVTIDPSEFSFLPGAGGLSRMLSVIFTEKKVDSIYTIGEDNSTTGMYWGAQEAGTNGLRHVLPTECRSICINVLNQYWAQRRDEHMATSIQLVYFDGETYNNGDGWENKGDGRPGYRWSYYASQQSGESVIQDGFGRTLFFEKIYTGEGLTVSFIPDTTHGYITCINGKEYCDAHDIMFFPDQNIPKTMEELESGKFDVDFSALAGVEGYLGIGAVGAKGSTNELEDYSVVSVNGIPAAQWKGEANTHVHTASEEKTVLAPDCLQFGISQVTCTECGAVLKQTVIDALDPENGHSFGEWTVVKEATYNEDGLRTRVCSACGVVEKEILAKINPFKDIELGKWYTEPCLAAFEHGFITGYEDSTFRPDNKLTRAQFVQILAKVAKVDLDKVEYKAKFTDVPNGKWYSKAVTWAVDFGVTGGVGGGLFAPDSDVSRAQIATFLRTYASKAGIDVSAKADITAYPDYKEVPSWASEALGWAVNAGLISGVKSGASVLLSPMTVATRAQAALIIVNFADNVLGGK